MGFSIFCILEACIFLANAVAILNDRFLMPYGLSMKNIDYDPGEAPPQKANMYKFNSQRGQIIIFIETFRKYMRCKFFHS